MTKYFQFFANTLFPFRSILLLLFVCSVSAIVSLLVFYETPTQDRYLIPWLLTLLWSLMLFVLCHSFYIKNKQPVEYVGISKWLNNLKMKLINLIVWLYSLLFLLLISASLYFTFKIVTI